MPQAATPSEKTRKKESVSRHLSSLWSITEMEEDYLTTKMGGQQQMQESGYPTFNAIVNMAEFNAEESVAEEEEGKANNISDIREILNK